jgi:predicted dehydrogenase
VDWVFIGSWNHAHREHAEAALACGKHVFCEKPLALSLEEAAAISRAVRAARDRHFAFGLVLRYSPLYRRAKSLLQAGSVGKVLSFEFNETLPFNHGGYIHGNWRRHTKHAGSFLLEKCCHDMDLAMWLMEDRPVRVASFGGLDFFRSENRYHQQRIGDSPRGETAFESWADPHRVNPFNDDKDIIDNQVAILDFEKGSRATFHTNCVSAIPERRFHILGTEGTLRLDAFTGEVEVRRIGWEEKSVIYKETEPGGHADADSPMARELAECMAGLREPAAGLREGIRSLVVVAAIDQAMHEGRVVDLQAAWRVADDL